MGAGALHPPLAEAPSTSAAGVKATTLVLLKAGARPGRADETGQTAQSIAEEEGHSKLVDLLLEWAPARSPTPEPEAHPIEPDAGARNLAGSKPLPGSVRSLPWILAAASASDGSRRAVSCTRLMSGLL